MSRPPAGYAAAYEAFCAPKGDERVLCVCCRLGGARARADRHRCALLPGLPWREGVAGKRADCTLRPASGGAATACASRSSAMCPKDVLVDLEEL